MTWIAAVYLLSFVSAVLVFTLELTLPLRSIQEIAYLARPFWIYVTPPPHPLEGVFSCSACHANAPSKCGPQTGWQHQRRMAGTLEAALRLQSEQDRCPTHRIRIAERIAKQQAQMNVLSTHSNGFEAKLLLLYNETVLQSDVAE